MRIKILVAIATLLLGLGTMYTTAKASQPLIFDQAISGQSLVQQPFELKLSPLDEYLKIANVPTQSDNDKLNDKFNELVKKHEEQIRQQGVTCLARNIYFEARGESKVGMIAVGQVTINRVKKGTFEDSICGVVQQHRGTFRNKPINCQFQWYCNGMKHKVIDKETYAEIVKIAEDLYDHYYIGSSYPDIVNGALFFHAKSADVGPRKWKKVVARIDNHIFYKMVAKL